MSAVHVDQLTDEKIGQRGQAGGGAITLPWLLLLAGLPLVSRLSLRVTAPVRLAPDQVFSDSVCAACER